MNNNDFWSNFKSFIARNKQIIMAYILSFAVIAIVIMFFSYIKKDNSNSIASYGEITYESSSDESKYETTEPSLKDDSTSSDDDSDTDEDSTLSDMDFTLPEDATEETETTRDFSSYPYLIKVNRLLNCITIYKQDSDGEYTIPHKAMTCSTGKNIMNTPIGTFRTSSKYTWRQMVDGTHSQYATRIYGGILFHSVPCYSPKKDQLEYMEFNKLGNPASLGCIRLTVQDSKWIYDNCPYGTTVVIYDDATSPGPLGKPQVIKIPENSPFRGWDPTDPDTNNPWRNCSPVITASDMTITAGSNVNILSTIKAIDSCGNDISSSISISGKFDKNTPGTYNVTLTVTDLLGRSDSKTIKIVVTKKSNSLTTTEKPSTTKPSTTKPNPTKPTEDKTTPQKPTSSETDESTNTEETTENDSETNTDIESDSSSESDSNTETTPDSSSETTSPYDVENDTTDLNSQTIE